MERAARKSRNRATRQTERSFKNSQPQSSLVVGSFGFFAPRRHAWITDTTWRTKRWCIAHADRRHRLLPLVASRRIDGARRNSLSVPWTMVGNDLCCRFDDSVFVCESSAVHIFAVDSAAAYKRGDGHRQDDSNKTSRFLGAGLSESDGCYALSFAGSEFHCVLCGPRGDLQHLHIV